MLQNRTLMFCTSCKARAAGRTWTELHRGCGTTQRADVFLTSVVLRTMCLQVILQGPAAMREPLIAKDTVIA